MKTIISLVVIAVISAALATASVYIDWVLLPETGVWVESDLPPQLQPSTKKVHVPWVSASEHAPTVAYLSFGTSGLGEGCEFPVSMTPPTLNTLGITLLISIPAESEYIPDDVAQPLIVFYPSPLRPEPHMRHAKVRIDSPEVQDTITVTAVSNHLRRDQESGEGLLSRTWLRSDATRDISALKPPASLLLQTLRFKTPSGFFSGITRYKYDLPNDGRGIIWIPSRSAEPNPVSIARLDKCDPFRLPILPPRVFDQLLGIQTQFRFDFLRERVKESFPWRAGLIFPALVAFRYWRPLLRVGARGARGTSDGLKALDAYDQQVRQ
jgi:hypothetical protein